MRVQVRNADGRVLEGAAEARLTFPQRLLGPLAVGDVFRESGGALRCTGLVRKREGAAADPADRTIRPHDAELGDRGRSLLLLLDVRQNFVPIVGMDAVDPAAQADRRDSGTIVPRLLRRSGSRRAFAASRPPASRRSRGCSPPIGGSVPRCRAAPPRPAGTRWPQGGGECGAGTRSEC